MVKAKGSGGFFRQVHALVARIPKGKVMTYGQIAKVLASPYSAKLVGFAMSGAPEGLPCHRVVNRLGEMAPGLVFGGSETQKKRLLREKVPFLPNGRIDLQRARFLPDDSVLEEVLAECSENGIIPAWATNGADDTTGEPG